MQGYGGGSVKDTEARRLAQEAKELAIDTAEDMESLEAVQGGEFNLDLNLLYQIAKAT